MGLRTFPGLLLRCDGRRVGGEKFPAPLTSFPPPLHPLDSWLESRDQRNLGQTLSTQGFRKGESGWEQLKLSRGSILL